MHEFSIAQEIVNILELNVPAESQHLVTKVKVKIGKFSNILSDSLLFCFDAIIVDTKFSKTKLEIETIPVSVNCNSCNEVIEIEPPIFMCPRCNGTNIKLISGNEMTIDQIELSD